MEPGEKLQPRQIIRILNTDIPGELSILMSLRKIKGIGFHLAHTICVQYGIQKDRKLRSFNEQEIKELEGKIRTLSNIEPWLLNRQKDYDTGENKHLLASDVGFRRDFDIKRLQKVKSYRGIRHGVGLPLRGQRTKAHFRKGRAVGVSKKAAGSKKK